MHSLNLMRQRWPDVYFHLTYHDGSFIKIRAMDFGYNFSTKMLGKAGIQSLRAYVSAQNPFILWAPLVRDGLGIDPEGNGTNGDAQ